MHTRDVGVYLACFVLDILWMYEMNNVRESVSCERVMFRGYKSIVRCY